MNKLFTIGLLAIILSACDNHKSSDSTFESYGTISIADDDSYCSQKILTDHGETLIPMNSSEHKMVSNDRVWIEYELSKKQNDCVGQDCKILQLKSVECKPYVDLYVFNYDSLKQNPIKINTIRFQGNCLEVNLSYSGGCESHQIDLARMHPSCGTPPLPPPTFEIRHNSNGDACEAWLTETLSFDLAPLRDEFEKPVKIVIQAQESEDTFFQEELTIKLE